MKSPSFFEGQMRSTSPTCRTRSSRLTHSVSSSQSSETLLGTKRHLTGEGSSTAARGAQDWRDRVALASSRSL
jgi:hypothetical protein